MSRTGYARLSNEFWRSPTMMEMLDINPAAVGFYVASVSYASDNLTDGLIEERVAKHSLRVPDDVIEFLVEEGKWEPCDRGWMIHNYAKWQNSREQVEAARERDRNRKARMAEKNIPDGFRSDSGRNENGIRHDVNQNQNQNIKPNNSSKVVEEVGESTCAHAREAATPATGKESGDESMIGAWKPCGEDYELARRLHAQGKPLVDVDSLAARYRDKLTGRGFEACGLGRHTPAALRAGFRMWISREAEWRAHDPKPTHTPPRVEPKPNAHSWSDVTVRHLMAPYRSMFPTAGEGGRGPSKPWYDACERVAGMLNDGMGEQEVAARLADEYDSQNTENEINNP